MFKYIKKNYKEIILTLIAIIVMISFAYGCYTLTRYLNFKFSYEKKVEEKICEMVKPEHLIKPCN